MPHLVPRLAILKRRATHCCVLAAFVASALCANSGCREEPIPKKKLVWDLSKSRNISSLSGSEWTSPPSPVYYIKGNRDLCLSVILNDDRRFDFDSVSDIYVDRFGTNITHIKVASFGYSKQGALDRAKEMHRQWNGQGIGDIDEWIADTDRGTLRGHSSIIHLSEDAEDPEIRANIYYNFGGKDSAWYIMTTFFWHDRTYEKPAAEEPIAERKAKVETADEGK